MNTNFPWVVKDGLIKLFDSRTILMQLNSILIINVDDILIKVEKTW
jgi:hypothetical protein